MSSNIETHIKNFLNTIGCVYEWLPINPALADTANFCEKYGYPINESGNTIIVSSKRGEKKHSACLVLASTRLDVNKKVKSLMKVSRLSFATSDETENITGMEIGGVTPFGLPCDLNIYTDIKVFDAKNLVLGAGSRSAKIIISPSELKKIPNLHVIEDLSFI
tara:strand:- start:45 stop:533 length:489 start_codon:yes stop_codon:yes gene_type:complete